MPSPRIARSVTRRRGAALATLELPADNIDAAMNAEDALARPLYERALRWCGW